VLQEAGERGNLDLSLRFCWRCTCSGEWRCVWRGVTAISIDRIAQHAIRSIKMAVAARTATWDTWSFKGQTAGQRRSELCVFIFRLLIEHTGWFGEAWSSVWLLQKDRVKVSLRPQTNC